MKFLIEIPDSVLVGPRAGKEGRQRVAEHARAEIADAIATVTILFDFKVTIFDDGGGA